MKALKAFIKSFETPFISVQLSEMHGTLRLIEAKFGDDPLTDLNYKLFIFGRGTCVVTKFEPQNFKGNRNRNKVLCNKNPHKSWILCGFESIGSPLIKTKYDRVTQ